MSPNAMHLVIAATLLAAPASLGVAAHTDGIDVTGLVSADEEAEEAESIEVFEGEVSEDVPKANLDLRIDRGTVKVVGWEKDSYEIEVLESADGSSLDQGETETEFDEQIEEDTVSLSLVVDHQSTSQMRVEAGEASVGDSAERAIVAHVPQRLAYEQVHVCEGESSSAPQNELVSLSPDAACVESSQPTMVHGTIGVTGHDDSGLDVAWGLQALEGEQAQVAADDGHVVLDELDFDQLAVETDNGAIEGAAITTTELEIVTDNGDVALEADADQATIDTHNGDVELVGAIAALEADSDNGQVAVESAILSDGSITTDNGAIELKIEPAESGDLSLATDNGAIDVHLAHGDDIGYNVDAAADNGDVDVALVDEEESPVEEEAEETGPDDRESARTSGYGDLPIQLAIQADSDNGAIQILEENANPDDEGSSGSSAGLVTLR